MPNVRAQADLRVQEAVSNIPEEPDQIDAICKIRDQFRIKENSEYYAVIQEYINEDINLFETTKRLFRSIDEEISKRDSVLLFSDLWHSILHSAKRVPFRNTKAHARLVEFVRVFKKRPHPPNTYNGYGPGGIFGSLSGFSYITRHIWHDKPGHGSGYTEPEFRAWANLNYFVACITKESLEDFSVYCIWAMREVLENEMKNDGPNDRFRPGTAVERYNALVPAAAVWVLVLAETLYETEEDMTLKFGLKCPNEALGGTLYKGKSGFNKKRWALWKRRFGEISQMEEVSEETRNLAKEAFNVMEQSDMPTSGHRYALRPRKTTALGISG